MMLLLLDSLAKGTLSPFALSKAIIMAEVLKNTL